LAVAKAVLPMLLEVETVLLVVRVVVAQEIVQALPEVRVLLGKVTPEVIQQALLAHSLQAEVAVIRQ